MLHKLCLFKLAYFEFSKKKIFVTTTNSEFLFRKILSAKHSESYSYFAYRTFVTFKVQRIPRTKILQFQTVCTQTEIIFAKMIVSCQYDYFKPSTVQLNDYLWICLEFFL